MEFLEGTKYGIKSKSASENKKELIKFIYELGIGIAGVADLSKLRGMDAGMDISLTDLFEKYPYAIVLGAQYGKLGKRAGGTLTAFFLERKAFDVMEYLEKKGFRILTIHTEDEFDPRKRMGLLSLKVLAKQAGLGWQGRSLLTVSPRYGPIHRLIALLTDMPLEADTPLENNCGDCRICIENCPVSSLRYSAFNDHPRSREEVLDINKCLGDNGCTVCITKCPYLYKN